MREKTVDIELLPAQAAFVRSTAPNVLYSGGYGSGKSVALCLKTCADHLFYPGNVIALLRQYRSDLRNTTLRTLIQGDGNLPPLLPGHAFEHNKQDSRIEVKGGATIFYMGFRDWHKLGSLNLGCVAVDEALELDEETFDMLQGRLRNSADPNPQMLLACNPGSPESFLYKRFFSGRGASEAVTGSSLENRHLPRSYIERLHRFSGAAYQRYVEGQWVAYEGRIFGRLKQAAVPRCSIDKVFLGVDAGFRQPFAVKVAVLHDGSYFVLDELAPADIPTEAFAELIADRWEPCPAYVDPSAPDLVAALSKQGFSATGAVNDFLPGISVVNHSDVLVGQNCGRLWSALQSYEWRPDGSDRPKAECSAFDHGPDALRYAVASWEKYGARDFSDILIGGDDR